MYFPEQGVFSIYPYENGLEYLQGRTGIFLHPHIIYKGRLKIFLGFFQPIPKDFVQPMSYPGVFFPLLPYK